MSRETFVYRAGLGVIPIQDAEPLPLHGERHGSGPMLISDAMPALRHMASGRVHESKSTFRRDTKSYGCVEVGSDAPTKRPKLDTKLPKPQQDIAEAWSQLEAGKYHG